METITVNGRYSGKDNGKSLNWEELGFDLVPVDYMYIMKCCNGETFSQGHLTPFGNIELNPSSGILNYGQGLFEGLKAYRGDDGSMFLFRPEENAMRMQMGADRMCMPSPTIHQFVDAVKRTVLANKTWVPPAGKGALYIRPLLMGTGPNLGLGPALEYTFLIFASPVGSYHKGSLHLLVEDNYHRAFPSGTGGIKSVTNYSPVYKVVLEAKAKGFSDVLFLDAATGKYVEEGSAANIFVVKGNRISTPPAGGTILPGITRKSIIEIARCYGYQVEERAVLSDELMEADEAFCTGTAMVVTPVSSVTHQGKRVEYRTGAATVSEKLYEILTGIQARRIEDKIGWTMKID